MDLDLSELDQRVRDTLADLEALMADRNGRLIWHDEAFQIEGGAELAPEVEGLLLALNELGYHLLRHHQDVHVVVPQPDEDQDPAEVRIPSPYARTQQRNWCIYRADYMAEHAAESLQEAGIPAVVQPGYIFPSVISEEVLERIFRIRDALTGTADGRADGDWLVADARGRDEG